MPYGGFSPVRLQGRYIRQGLPDRVRDLLRMMSVCLRPSYTKLNALLSPHSVGGRNRLAHLRSSGHCRSTPGALAPVWVILSQSINAYLAPSAPLAGSSRLRRIAAYTRCPRCAFRPRRSASGSALSLLVLARHAVLSCPRGTRRLLTTQFLRRRLWPSSARSMDSAFPSVSHHPFQVGIRFRGFLVRTCFRICYGLSSCSPP